MKNVVSYKRVLTVKNVKHTFSAFCNHPPLHDLVQMKNAVSYKRVLTVKNVKHTFSAFCNHPPLQDLVQPNMDVDHPLPYV